MSVDAHGDEPLRPVPPLEENTGLAGFPSTSAGDDGLHPWPAAVLQPVGSFRLALHVLGDVDAPPVLMVHGLGSSSLAFAPAARRLASTHRVICVDLPGFGDSDKKRYRYTLAFYAERLVRLMDVLGLERCPWVAHSMGAQIAIWASLLYPDRISSLVLAAPAGLESFRPHERALLEQTVSPGWVRRQKERHVRENMALAFHRMPKDVEILVQRRLAMKGPELDGFAHAFAASVRAMLEAPVRKRLGEVRAPTMVLFGDDDRLVPNRMFRPRLRPHHLLEQAREVMGAETVLMEDTGHLLPFEQPVAFVEAIRPFLQRNP